MDITEAQFIRGITGSDSILDDDRPQVAFVGRSNVGKSSVINALLNRNNLAHSSSKPGKTQEINFYLVNGTFYFVDLPGFGYAKISAQRAERIRKQMIWYLGRQSSRPRAVVHIIDAKAGITEKDKDMLDIIAMEEYPLILLVNKIDKLNQSETVHTMRDIKKTLEEHTFAEVNAIAFSAKTKKGRDEALESISKYISA